MVKFTLVLGVAALKCATATTEQIFAQINNATRSSDPQARNLLNSAEKTLNGYGCWCYFDSDLDPLAAGRPGPGRGKTVDPVDNACKILHQAYDCIIMDIEAMGGWTNHQKVLASDAGLTNEQRLAAGHETECIPWTQAMLPAIATSDANGIYSACLELNQPNVFQGLENEPLQGIGAMHPNLFHVGFGRCATLACAVEGTFSDTIKTLQQSVLARIDEFGHEEGFDPDTECLVADVHNNAEEPQCCGVYPSRYKYHPKNKWGERGCCGQSVFDSNLFECCDEATSVFDTTCPVV
jgi:hypothetical protein